MDSAAIAMQLAMMATNSRVPGTAGLLRTTHPVCSVQPVAIVSAVGAVGDATASDRRDPRMLPVGESPQGAWSRRRVNVAMQKAP